MSRPNSKRNLDMAIRRMGNTDEDYLQNRMVISNAVVSQMLPPAVIKGGSSLKLRFGNEQTRATSDLDIARKDSIELFTHQLEERLAAGWEGFTGRLITLPKAKPKNVPEIYVMQPFDIKLSYNGKPWCTVRLEVGHNEISDADAPDFFVASEAESMLENMGFEAISLIPGMNLGYQIAQKLHGLSEKNSSRVHDLVDLQIIIANSKVDYVETKQICKRLFDYRKLQQWPPHIHKNPNWDTLYLAASEGLDVVQDIDLAIDWVNDLIAGIHRSS